MHDAPAGSFTRVLRSPGVVRTALPYTLARIGLTMELLALLLAVHDRTGSFAVAGLTNAAFATGAAVVAPVLGRAVDRLGQPRVLTVCALVHLGGLLSVLALTGGPRAALLATAVLTGASVPPLSSCMRVLWPDLVPEPLRGTAYALESLLVEVCELAGPASVGAVVFLVAPQAALLTAAALVTTGTLVFATSPASRRWRTRRAAARPAGPVLSAGPMRVRSVRSLVLVVLLCTASLAALEVAVARFASLHGHPAATGPLLALLVVSSLVGAWWWGRTPRTAPLGTQLVGLLGACAVLTAAPLLANGFVVLALALVVAGFLVAPATAVQFVVLTEAAPEDNRTEAFTWASTAGFLGVAAGTALGGLAASSGGAHAVRLLALGLAVAAALAGLHTRATLRAVAAPAVVPLDEHEAVRQERDDALAAARVAGERCDELARELARLRQELPPVPAAPQQRAHLRAVDDVLPPADVEGQRAVR